MMNLIDADHGQAVTIGRPRDDGSFRGECVFHQGVFRRIGGMRSPPHPSDLADEQWSLLEPLVPRGQELSAQQDTPAKRQTRDSSRYTRVGCGGSAGLTNAEYLHRFHHPLGSRPCSPTHVLYSFLHLCSYPV